MVATTEAAIEPPDGFGAQWKDILFLMAIGAAGTWMLFTALFPWILAEPQTAFVLASMVMGVILSAKVGWFKQHDQKGVGITEIVGIYSFFGAVIGCVEIVLWASLGQPIPLTPAVVLAGALHGASWHIMGRLGWM
jgi:hypothetical protein